MCCRRRRGGGPLAAVPNPAARRALAAAATAAQIENFCEKSSKNSGFGHVYGAAFNVCGSCIEGDTTLDGHGRDNAGACTPKRSTPHSNFYVVFVRKTESRQKFSNFSRKFFDVFVIAEIFWTARKNFKIKLTPSQFDWSKNHRNRSHPGDFSAI